VACDRACAYVCVLLVVALLTSQFFSSSSSAVPHRRLRLHFNIILYASIIEYVSARAPVCVCVRRYGSYRFLYRRHRRHPLFISLVYAHSHTRVRAHIHEETGRVLEYTATTGYDDDDSSNNNNNN